MVNSSEILEDKDLFIEWFLKSYRVALDKKIGKKLSIESWLYLILICLMGASSPGPSLIVILRHAVADGRSAGIYAAVGHGLGIFIYALVSAIGLSFILISSPKIFSFVQILGALFLLWIGFQILREGYQKKTYQILGNIKHVIRHTLNHFRDGFGIAILNPKILAFFLLYLVSFCLRAKLFYSHIMAIIAGFIDVSVYVIIVFLVTLKACLNFIKIRYFLWRLRLDCC